MALTDISACYFMVFLASKFPQISAAFFASSLTVLVSLALDRCLYQLANHVIYLRVTTDANKLALIRQIAAVTPGPMYDWDDIAVAMDPLFCSRSPLPFPYFFYNGESCYSFVITTDL
ncbi:LADA_0C02784g1_1 [Lachancea dasiensis]|uniref:LADA_0C02784g1_1 n=1 Tax=Lachancea dasiensis TaxID=1072105 RepID=A0A1G4IY30_9SACH|nr:LADA_0C02784g1_1 [Lachancea dasiensis]